MCIKTIVVQLFNLRIASISIISVYFGFNDLSGCSFVQITQFFSRRLGFILFALNSARIQYLKTSPIVEVIYSLR